MHDSISSLKVPRCLHSLPVCLPQPPAPQECNPSFFVACLERMLGAHLPDVRHTHVIPPPIPSTIICRLSGSQLVSRTTCATCAASCACCRCQSRRPICSGHIACCVTRPFRRTCSTPTFRTSSPPPFLPVMCTIAHAHFRPNAAYICLRSSLAARNDCCDCRRLQRHGLPHRRVCHAAGHSLRLQCRLGVILRQKTNVNVYSIGSAALSHLCCHRAKGGRFVSQLQASTRAAVLHNLHIVTLLVQVRWQRRHERRPALSRSHQRSHRLQL